MKKQADFLFFLLTLFCGFLLGALTLSLISYSPREVCQADCEVRGFQQGQFVTEPEHCTCWNRDFEKPSPAQEGESL